MITIEIFFFFSLFVSFRWLIRVGCVQAEEYISASHFQELFIYGKKTKNSLNSMVLLFIEFKWSSHVIRVFFYKFFNKTLLIRYVYIKWFIFLVFYNVLELFYSHLIDNNSNIIDHSLFFWQFVDIVFFFHLLLLLFLHRCRIRLFLFQIFSYSCKNIRTSIVTYEHMLFIYIHIPDSYLYNKN